MKLELEIQAFKELISKAAELHNWSFCVKRQLMVRTLNLDARECVTCHEFILRGGICDPL